ncbi:MAG: hypothetical protein ACI4M9_06285 [Succinivibrio sp.]
MAKVKTTEATAVAESWPRIYVGPSIPKGYLKANMVFADGLGTVAQELINKYPELNTLIVPTKNYVTAMSEVSRVGSRLHSAYEKALNIKGE